MPKNAKIQAKVNTTGQGSKFPFLGQLFEQSPEDNHETSSNSAPKEPQNEVKTHVFSIPSFEHVADYSQSRYGRYISKQASPKTEESSIKPVAENNHLPDPISPHHQPSLPQTENNYSLAQKFAETFGPVQDTMSVLGSELSEGIKSAGHAENNPIKSARTAENTLVKSADLCHTS